LYQRLKHNGLLVVPGKYFFPGQQSPSAHGECCIRMSYAQSEPDLEQGIGILARELRACWA
jgi:valine--pyruvate aminotransferase